MKSKIKRIISPFFLISAAILAAGLAIRIAASQSAAFADFWQTKVASVPRAALAYMTNIFPFSIAESIILTAPLTVALFIYFAGKSASDSWAGTFRYSLNLLGAAAIVYAVLLVNFSAGYYTTPLDQRLGLQRREVSAEELYDTAYALIDGVRDNIDGVGFVYGEGSVMPYSLGEMNKKLNAAYETACEKYGFISKFRSNPKPVALSEPWTYTHISGVYTFFTGEANINVNFPDYTIPYTAAHEMAHQRGIAREDEANFVAFLVCLESDDPYIRYSGYASVYEYVATSLYSADRELYRSLYAQRVPALYKNEMIAYNEFFERYRENKVAEVSEKVNNGYLQAHGQPEGTRSYGLVVDLAVAYYKAADRSVTAD